MSRRLNNILEHISIQGNDGETVRAVKRDVAMAALTNQFTMSVESMRQIMTYLLYEMVEGLEGRESTVRMLPSYVYKADPKRATGVFYALDLGGTNFRVLRVACKEGAVVDSSTSAFKIPKYALEGNATDLFGFIASNVKKTMETRAPEDLNRTVPLGFTFSFPVEQTKVNRGVLIRWTKGFSTKGVQGNDVIALLQAAFGRVSLKVNVVALCNDTVGTLISHYFKDPEVQVGVIIGTGSNACYFETASAVTKDPAVAARGSALTPINMESGNFDSKYRFVLPTTKFDLDIDDASLNKGQQALEKMISGMYLGEIARRVIVHLSSINCLPAALQTALGNRGSFESRFAGMISADRMPGLQFTRSTIQKVCGVDVQSIEDLRIIRDVCRLVRGRAAQLSASFCCAPLVKTQTQGRATIAIDGSVFEKIPSFRRVLQDNINRILGPECDVRAVLAKDGSGIGAAFISAMVVNDK
ncbi:hexokinase [Trypanosoma brucei brucei TREU927]|uniref:Phosphotransferase n=1 Tax=Trypanosoma brucei brucei (strain 927/4 GUTat10.1) TaxID=185431 RepID=Q38C42_TRYB2|nr:hexokinase [Trypanosoma brucei brucei TREU927]EAN77628.1 hexokinase [Trypanosoma brucei brucei TREU927]